MSVGSILIGVALLLVVGAYLARPFRRTQADLDQALERWVAQVRAEKLAPTAFCPSCGQPVAAENRFCRACGKSLRGEPG